MVLGGKTIDLKTGEHIEMHVSGEPEFSMGEWVLLFLTNKPNPFYERYPHDGYRLFHNAYGKIEIKDNKLELIYFLDIPEEVTVLDPQVFTVRVITVPTDLVVQLGLAFVKNKDEVTKLENVLRAIAQKEDPMQQSEFL